MKIGVHVKMPKALQKFHHGFAGKDSHYKRCECDASLSPKSECGDLVPSDVPAGYLVVYVGEERRRFVIKAKTLKHDTMKVLLEKSAEEYGFKHEGGLVIACDVDLFEWLLRSIESKDPSVARIDLRHYWAFTPDNGCYRVLD